MKHVALAVVLTVALALSGCLVKKSTHQKALDHISELEGRIAALEKEEADRKAALAELEKALAAARGDLDTTTKTKEDRKSVV